MRARGPAAASTRVPGPDLGGELRPSFLLGEHRPLMVPVRNRLAGYLAEARLDIWLLVRVGHLAVDSEVARHQLGVRHPQLHEQPDAAQDEERHQAIPDD